MSLIRASSLPEDERPGYCSTADAFDKYLMYALKYLLCLDYCYFPSNSTFKMDAKETLKAHVSQLVTLTDAQFEHLYAHFKPMSFTKGQEIIAAGDLVDSEYFVLSGCLKSFFIDDDRKMYVLQFAMKNWWTSDYDALYNQSKAAVHIDCVLDADVLRLTNQDREKVCKEIHEIERFFRLRTNRGYVASQKRLLSVMTDDARERYEALIRQYPELYKLLPKTLIAAYLGVSRETLSRLYNDEK